ncbi:MAG: aminopeptidase P family N-terminal domain-containing protein [Saprospiraceae bacterium]|nr:aminopeptidase P family N-terminal domain-containing protein [Saprospiraceae bacterium]
MTINEKISRLRQAMQAQGIDAYLIPSSDPHQSEYLPDHWKTRQWISGFTGSAGLVIVTQNHAGLWTDSRYFLQAETELKDTAIELHKQIVPHAPEHVTWLQENLKPGATLGLDGSLFSVGQNPLLEKHLHSKQIKLDYNIDLIDAIWLDRPALPTGTIFEFDEQFAGESRASN